MTLPTSTYWTAAEGYEPDNPLGAMPVLPTGIDPQGEGFRRNALAMNLGRMEQIYKERTALLPQQIEEFQRHDVFFYAEAAQKAGIVHDIAALAIPAGAAITVVNTAPNRTPQ